MRGRFRGILPLFALVFFAGPWTAPAQLGNKPYSLTRPGPSQSRQTPLPDLKKITLDDRRYLLYLYSRLNRLEMVEAVAEQILSENPRDKETLLALAGIYLEQNQPARALEVTGRLVEYYPTDTEALYHRALAYDLSGQKAEAREILSNLKTSQFANKPFPYERELASTASESGNWSLAISAYQEALKNPQLTEESRVEIRRALEELYRAHLPQILLEATAIGLNSGSIYRLNAEFSAPLNLKHRLNLKWARDDIELKNSVLVRHTWSHRDLALAGVESQWLRPLRSKVWAGATDEGEPVYGGLVGFTWRQSHEWVVEYAANEPALDSLTLEVLNGRQDRLSLFYNWQIDEVTSAGLRWDGRKFFVQDEYLGEGYVINASVERVVWRRFPQLRAGYRGLLTGYSQRSENVELVEPIVKPRLDRHQRLETLNNLARANLHRHGLYLALQNVDPGRFNYRVIMATDYALELMSIEYEVGAGASYFPRKSIELRLDADYSTSANTSDRDSDRLQFILVMKYYF